MKTIILTGMMGSGKTTVGVELAKKLALNFIDVDSEIEKEQKCTITEIFEKYGEEYFRKLEAKKIEQVLMPNNVIALGGGAFENEAIRKLLLEKSKVIYLKTSAQEILKRIENTNNRPLLKNKMNLENIMQIIKKREANYKKAHLTVETNKKEINKIIEEILKWLF